MSKYQWNMYDIRNKHEFMKHLMNYAYTKKEQNKIKNTILVYDEMLMILASYKKEAISTFQSDIETTSKKESLKILKNFIRYNNKYVLKKLLESYSILEPFNQLEELEDEDKILKSFTNRDLINTTIDFFSDKTLKELSEKIEKFLTSNSDFLHIDYHKTSTDYSGVTIYDPHYQNKYIYVCRHNTLLDLIILPHEMFHYLYGNFDASSYNSDGFYLHELEGCFANILFGDYYKEKYNNSFFIDYYLQLGALEIQELVISDCIYKALKLNGKVSLQIFHNNFSTYFTECSNEEELLSSYIESPVDISDNMKYSFSYLTAIDLYSIYLKDREKAFYLLQNITARSNEKNILNVLRENGITFMDDNYQNLKQYTNKIKRNF